MLLLLWVEGLVGRVLWVRVRGGYEGSLLICIIAILDSQNITPFRDIPNFEGICEA